MCVFTPTGTLACTATHAHLRMRQMCPPVGRQETLHMAFWATPHGNNICFTWGHSTEGSDLEEFGVCNGKSRTYMLLVFAMEGLSSLHASLSLPGFLHGLVLFCCSLPAHALPCSVLRSFPHSSYFSRSLR